MADALISPIVGGTMLAATSSIITYSIKKIQRDDSQDKLPLMSILGAFVFASQMVNFTIPGTGASGHLGGGMLLAILLGPYGGFLSMAAILLIQALFFADGGLLAYGCNVFNLGFYTCFIAYPFIYKPIMNKGFSKRSLLGAIMLSSIIGLQLGSFSVVIETLISGKTNMPFSTFLLAMQPIHLAIGIVEGTIISAVVSFIYKTNPLLIDNHSTRVPKLKMKKLVMVFAVCTFIVGVVFSLAASSNPDGLEWALLKTTGTAEVSSKGIMYEKLEWVQEHIAVLPDYGFKNTEEEAQVSAAADAAGTSTSGIAGTLLTSAFIAIIGALCYGLKVLKLIPKNH
jgi:cobalt/nickel transport system permease protein